MALKLYCQAFGCTQPREPKQVFCRACWALVPRQLRDELYRTYGQGLDGNWLRALKDAGAAVKAFSNSRPSGQTLRSI